MSIKKLVHDVPFVVDAAKRQLQPAPPKPDDKRLVVDEMHELMKDLSYTATPSDVVQNVRKITIKKSL